MEKEIECHYIFEECSIRPTAPNPPENDHYTPSLTNYYGVSILITQVPASYMGLHYTTVVDITTIKYADINI